MVEKHWHRKTKTWFFILRIYQGFPLPALFSLCQVGIFR